jgi:hypothetical protein
MNVMGLLVENGSNKRIVPMKIKNIKTKINNWAGVNFMVLFIMTLL